MAIGCIQAQKCHTDHCPVGVATQNPRYTRGLDVGLKSVRAANYIRSFRRDLLKVAEAVGVVHPGLIAPGDVDLLDGTPRTADSRIPGIVAELASPACTPPIVDGVLVNLGSHPTKGRPAERGEVETVTFDTGKLGESISAADYVRATQTAHRLGRQMAAFHQQYDVLLTPGAPGPAPEGMATGDPVMQAPWSLADFPTMTLPSGLSSNGMPLGIQLTAAPLHEGLLLETAEAVEAIIGFEAKPLL